MENTQQKKDLKMTWPRVIGLALAVPALFYPREYWGYSSTGVFMFPHLSAINATLLCTFSGALCGLMFKGVNEPFKKNIIPRILAGALSGSLTIWIFAAYLYFRDYPQKMYDLEGFVVSLIALLPGMMLYFMIIALTPKDPQPEEETATEETAGRPQE